MAVHLLQNKTHSLIMNNRIKVPSPGLASGLFLILVALAILSPQASAQTLGSAENFAVLGASTVTNAGASQLSGSVGVSPGTAITGFPPGIITNGELHPGDASATQAHADLATAYTEFAALDSPPANNLSDTDLGLLTLTPGVYRYDTSAVLGDNGTLTFDALDDPDARFIIQIGTTLITSSSSSVVLVNGAQARNIYFLLGTAAILGGGSSFIGNILAGTAITTVANTTVTGRLLSVTEAVTLNTNNVHPKRGLAPGLVPTSVLADPTLELRNSNGMLIVVNNDSQDNPVQAAMITAAGLAPTDSLESAIAATLPPGLYTALLSGRNNSTRIGVVEIYDPGNTP